MVENTSDIAKRIYRAGNVDEIRKIVLQARLDGYDSLAVNFLEITAKRYCARNGWEYKSPL